MLGEKPEKSNSVLFVILIFPHIHFPRAEIYCDDDDGDDDDGDDDDDDGDDDDDDDAGGDDDHNDCKQ